VQDILAQFDLSLSSKIFCSYFKLLLQIRIIAKKRKKERKRERADYLESRIIRG